MANIKTVKKPISGMVRVISLNINGGSMHKGRGMDDKRAMLALKSKKYAADVVALQETKHAKHDKQFLNSRYWDAHVTWEKDRKDGVVHNGC
jgi:exonuclease III